MKRATAVADVGESPYRTRQTKVVRLVIPLYPRAEMTDRRRSERLERQRTSIVDPKDPVMTTQSKLGSGSGWSFHEMRMLGAEFWPDRGKDLSVLAKDPEWDTSQRDRKVLENWRWLTCRNRRSY